MPGSAPGEGFLFIYLIIIILLLFFFYGAGQFHWGPGNRTRPHPGVNRRSILGDRVPHVRFLRVTRLGPGKSAFSAPRHWKALDFPLMVTAAGSRGPAQSQRALPPALPPLLHPSPHAQHPAAAVTQPALGGSRRGRRGGRGPGLEPGAGEAELRPRPPSPSPMAVERKRGPRSPGSQGHCRVGSWLQTLASRMPSVDERCIME